MAFRLEKYFQNTKGIDLSSSDLVRIPGAATDMVNGIYRDTGALSKRPGFQLRTDTGTGGLGTFKFNDTNITTGVVSDVLVTTDDNLYTMSEETITITYAGADTAYIDLYLDSSTSTFKFDIYDDNVLVSTTDLGTGKGGSDTTMAQLKVIIDAVSDFSCVISGSTGVPAASIDVQRNTAITATAIAFKAFTAVSTPTGYTDPFALHYAARNDDDFENASFAQLNDALYIANGYDALHKYDGTRVYKAGLPLPATPVPTELASGSLANGTYKYKVTFEYTDAKSNYIEGEASAEATVTTVGGFAVSVAYTVLATSSGYDTNSTNLKINIYRTKTGGSIFYLVTSLTNATASPYTDSTADSALTTEFNIPVKVPNLPPVCRYIDVWRNQLVMTGDKTSVNTVYYSDIGLEVFPSDQSFTTNSRLGGANSGVKALDNALFVFKPESISAVSGDLGTDSFTVDNLSDHGIGCVANATMQEIEGKIWFLGNQGIYSLNNQGVTLESRALTPIFSERAFIQKRATSLHWIEKELYAVLLPKLLTGGASSKYLDLTSNVIVFDRHREAWYKWDNINMLGGAAESTNQIYFSGMGLDPTSSNATAHTHQFLNAGDLDDYNDGEDPVNFTYKSHWESLGEPSVYKKFHRIKVHSLDGSVNDFEVQRFVLTIVTEHNYDPITVSSTTMDFSGGASGWGASGWGSFPWGESRLEQLRKRLAATKAKSLRVIFTNNVAHENILISGYELEVAAPYDLQLKE